MKNEKEKKLPLIHLSLLFMSLLITVIQMIFWDCGVHFKFFALFTDNLSRNNCIRFTGYLQLHIYENLHSLSILRFLGLFRWGRKNRGRAEEGVGSTRN